MFTSRQIKHSRLLLRHTRKYLRYKRDKLSDADRDQIVAEMQTLREALRSRDRQNIHSAAETLDKTLHKLTPVTWESHWRENCEVILVAIVIAVGRTRNDELARELEARGLDVHTIGDALDPRNIQEAIAEGAAVARELSPAQSD